MDSQNQTQESYPDPVDVITAFVEGHSQMIDSVRQAFFEPNHPSILYASDHLQRAVKLLQPYAIHDFFRVTDNELAVGTAISSVKAAVEDTAAQIVELDKNSQVMAIFEDDAVDDWTKVILDGEDVKAGKLTTDICNLYIGFVNNLETALLNSGPVQSFIEAERQDAKHKEQWLQFGGVMLAAFIGTRLAQKTSR